MKMHGLLRKVAGAEGGSRTRTSFRTTDFKSAASAIPPPRHVVRNSNSTKPFRFSANYQYRNVNNVVRGTCGTTVSVFARVSLPSHLLKTLGLAQNSPVKSNARYGVPSAGELSQTA